MSRKAALSAEKLGISAQFFDNVTHVVARTTMNALVVVILLHLLFELLHLILRRTLREGSGACYAFLRQNGHFTGQLLEAFAFLDTKLQY